MTFSRTRRLHGAPRISGAILLASMLGALPADGREDPVELIRRHRYDEAISTWDKELAGAKADEKSLRALKGKSLAYFRLGSLYGVYEDFSNAIMSEYYNNLLADGATALHYLYMGQIQFQAGRLAEAKASFDKAKSLGGMGPAVAEMSDVFAYNVRRRLGESGGDQPAPKDNAAAWQALELRGSGASEIPAGLAGASQRGRRCKLQILLRGGAPSQTEVENTLKAVLGDAQQPEMYLDQGKNTQINFYDPFLMGALSEAYYALSKLTNIRVKEEEKSHPELASKFNTNLALAEASIRLGHWKDAANYLGTETGEDAQLLKAQLMAGQGRAKEAVGILEELAAAAKSPASKRDIADSYYLLRLDLDKGLKLAAQAVREKNGSNYHRTYASLLFAAGQTDAALQAYAKGYKIEYRNRIDQIDPEYMSDYSFAIFRTNKLRYEEIVETLYHLQKEFPACRQMHYCMQGISAGLARSFESQRIFRKGG